jgi:hypothetical protein
MNEPTSKDHDLSWGNGLGYLLFLGVIGVVFITRWLPNSSVNRAGISEARNNVGAMNRGQQAYWYEHNTFAQSLETLQMGIHPETRNYRYSTQSVDGATFQYGISRHPAIFKRPEGSIWGIFPRRGKEYALPSYLGIVWLKPNQNVDSDGTQNNIQHSLGIMCESTYPYLLEESFEPIAHNGDFSCPEGMKNLSE